MRITIETKINDKTKISDNVFDWNIDAAYIMTKSCKEMREKIVAVV